MKPQEEVLKHLKAIQALEKRVLNSKSLKKRARLAREIVRRREAIGMVRQALAASKLADDFSDFAETLPEVA